MRTEKSKVAAMRKSYKAKKLDKKDLHKNPITQFDRWFQEAIHSKVKEPNAMTLATATPSGKPSARIVLLKGFDEKGFIFYTNYNSSKGQQLIKNPNAALVFCWLDLERQIRIEGKVKKLSKKASTAYFHSRPKSSQIGAAASPQSSIIKDRRVLEKAVKALNKTHSDSEVIPRPEHWGGFILRPTMIEFWQGRPSRLHDRMRYQKKKGEWVVDRLAP